MKTTRPTDAITLVFVVIFSFLVSSQAQQGLPEDAEPNEIPVAEPAVKPSKTTPKRSVVRMADFYLKDGKLVSGKLLADDRNKITVERIEGPTVAISTYSKMEIDARTIDTRRIPQYQYYLDLAEYFTGRTWDFQDDPDDFIQAIRCLEKAKELLTEEHSGQSEKIEDANNKIIRLEADRQRWIKQAESRAELKKLEFEAEFDIRLKDLEDKIISNNKKIEDIIADIRQDRLKLQNATNAMATDISEQLEMLTERINYNTRIIDHILNRWRRFPPHGWLLPEDLDRKQ